MKPSRLTFIALLIVVLGVLSTTVEAMTRTSSPTFELRSDAAVTNDEVTVADLVKISGLSDRELQQVGARRVMAAPPLGQFVWMPRERLRRVFADIEPFSRQTWTGAAAVRIRRDAQTVDALALCRTAQDAVREALGELPPGAAFDSECTPPSVPVLLPAGAIHFRAIGDRLSAASGVQDVTIVVESNGKPARMVHVAVRTHLQADLRCAAADIKAGDSVVDSLFEPCRRPVTDPRQLHLTSESLQSHRLKHSLRQGEVLSNADLIDATAPLRGEGVAVVYRIGSIELVSRGELRQDGKVGDAVRVRLLNSGQTIVGKLAAAQRVEIEELP